MATPLLLSSAYLAPVSYYVLLYAYGRAWVEQYDHYAKQTYRNRCVIGAPDGPLALTIPVTLNHSGKTPMRDVRISDHGNWRHLHWNALTSAYFNSPFFAYYADDFRPFYEKRYEFLIDFNEALHHTVCELIGLTAPTQRTAAFGELLAEDPQNAPRNAEKNIPAFSKKLGPFSKNLPAFSAPSGTAPDAYSGEAPDAPSGAAPYALSEGVADYRERIHPKRPWREGDGYVPRPYYQVFAARHGFLPDLSIADLLFNMGPESLLVLRDSARAFAAQNAASAEK